MAINYLSDEEYQALGLKSGLEIHQQIYTEKKLFCRCPGGHYSDTHDAEVLRHMRPTLSEMGEYDGTALMEFKTKKEIVYLLNCDSVCTYEMDDTPPFDMNMEALKIGLRMAALLNCKLVGEVHIIRKQYLDGSIPTGFQRTAIIGVDGWIPYRGEKLGIFQLSIEEDSCREVSDIGHRRLYRTDRLSMPLIETVTHAGMHTPQQVAEVARILSLLVRNTGLVRRGLGSVRQDVNVSITGGTRVEIKGVPRIPLIPALVHFEALRQKGLLEIKDLLTQRGIDKDTLRCDTRVLNEEGIRLNAPLLRKAWAAGQTVRAIKLTGFGDIITHPLQSPHPYTFADELAGRVRVVACLESRPVLLHNRELVPGGPSAAEWEILGKIFHVGENDALVLVWGPEVDSKTAAQEIELRCREATLGVPSETRQAFDDGHNGFERILPGPDRMYPDTDLPPIPVSNEFVHDALDRMPEQVWLRQERYTGWGIDPALADLVIASPWGTALDRAVNDFQVPAKVAARVLGEMPRYLSRLHRDIVALFTTDRLDEIWTVLRDFPALAEDLPLVLRAWAEGIPQNFKSQFTKENYAPLNRDQVVRLAKAAQISLGQEIRVREKLSDYLMGDVMRVVRGKFPGRSVREIVAECA